MNPLQTQSFFIFGPRGTGKSTWLRQAFSGLNPLWIDLLHAETEDFYRRDPSVLSSQLRAMETPPRWVVIDEVQKLPKLLDEVHSLIESSSTLFALTGSSARKLKKASANLLAGRAFVNFLFPLTQEELGKSFDLDFVLRWGSLPRLFSLPDETSKTEYLRSYALTYLREEIQLEQIVRKIEPFRDFLEIAAIQSGKPVNASKISKEIGIDFKSVQSYFEILESTWIGFRLPSYHRSIRKSQREASKFYFFDLGVKRALERTLDTIPRASTSYFGELFEHWVIQEFYRSVHYLKKDYRLCYLSTYADNEIDLIIDRGRAKNPIVLEVKSSERIDASEVRKLEALAKDLNPEKIIYVSRDPQALKIGKVSCMPWFQALQDLKAW